MSAPPGAAAVRLGLIVSPEVDEEAAERLREELAEALDERYGGSRWTIEVEREPLAEPPAHLTALVDAARRRLLDQDWDLVAAITELPLRYDRRPLLSHVSRTHGVALISLPALGVLQRHRRLRRTLTDAVAALLGELPDDGAAAARPRLRRRLRELAAAVDEDEESEGVAFLARVIGGNLGLLAGMVRANHPWRLTSHLGRAMVAALAAAAFSLVTADLWRMAAHLDPLRLLLAMVGSVAAAAVSLIAAHDLWERAPDPSVREQVTLFNLATLATVLWGISALYLGVFLLSLIGAALLIDPSLLSQAIHRDADAWDYLKLAWLASSMATVGGALGATVESDEAVREAAYAYRPERQRSHAQPLP